jgi:hypothetical protein
METEPMLEESRAPLPAASLRYGLKKHEQPNAAHHAPPRAIAD